MTQSLHVRTGAIASTALADVIDDGGASGAHGRQTFPLGIRSAVSVNSMGATVQLVRLLLGYQPSFFSIQWHVKAPSVKGGISR